MKVDVNKVLVDYDNKPLRFKPAADEDMKDAQVKDVVLPLLLSPSKQSSWQDHMKRDELSRKIYLSKEEPVELSSEDISMIKSAMGQSNFSPVAVAQVVRILEGQDV